MEIQKHLFRISERALKSPNAKCWWNSIFYLTATLAIYSTLVLVFGHVVVLPTNTYLSSCLKSHGLQLQPDAIYQVNDGQLSPQSLKSTHLADQSLLITSAECSILKGKNYTYEDDFMVTFGYDMTGIFMERQKREQMNYDNYTIMLKGVSPMRRLVFGFEVLMINQLLANPEKVFLPERLAIKSKIAYIVHEAGVLGKWEKVWYLLKVLVCYTGISVVTSLYIYGTVVAAPAVILLILRSCNFMRPEGFNDVFKLFPWIGTHAIIRETSNTPAIKQSTAQICKAILFYFFFLYLVYYAIIIWIDKRLYRSHVEMGLQEMVFGLIALVEFAAIVFMRTRTFLKYYPAFHSLLIVTLLYYGQVTDFGFKKLACYTAFATTTALFSWMVSNLQIPAHTTWDPNHLNTPREDRPRAGFFPLFNMGWIKNLPEEWTMLMPLFGREHFSGREMALVDRNDEELAEVLGNNR